MTMSSVAPGGPLPGEARYRISVLGTLDSTWSERLGGLALAFHVDRFGRAITDLVGSLDQAALMGVLHRLYTYGAVLLSLEQLDDPDLTSREDDGQ